MANFLPKPKRSADWNYGGPKWKLSRSKIDLFMECPRCFYLDNKLGVSRPRGPAFTLNIAVDALLKREFDAHRASKTAHPLMSRYGVDAIPFTHKNLEAWRENFVGIQSAHKPTGMLICGAIDDVWLGRDGKLIVVDYKATSKDGDMKELSDTRWENQYRRQIEVYQWLLRRNGFDVSDVGYFVYVNGRKDKAAFDGKLEFDVTLIPHEGDDTWVEAKLGEIKECLEGKELPKPDAGCEFCNYRKNALEVQAKFAVPRSRTKKTDDKDQEGPRTKKDIPEGKKTERLF